MKRILIIITILAASGMAYSQSALKKLADKSFEKQDFQTAAASYERLVQKGDSSFEILFKLGDAYYFNANYLKANAWYVKGYNQSKQLTANQFHHFIQTLKSVGNKEESNRVMDAFSKAFPQDLRVKNNVNSEKYFQNPLQVSIKNLTINSAYSDYGASLYKDSLVFSSARPTLISSLDYYRTDQPFTNLFVATKSDSTYSHVSLLKKEVTYSAFHEATPVFTKDGKTVYFTRNNYIKGKLGADADKLQGVFVTVDPARDTAALLTAYMSNFDPTFVAFVPKADELADVAKRFKIYYKKQEGKTPTSYTMDHSAGSYVYDTQGNVRLYSRYGAGAKVLAQDIQTLLKTSP